MRQHFRSSVVKPVIETDVRLTDLIIQFRGEESVRAQRVFITGVAVGAWLIALTNDVAVKLTIGYPGMATSECVGQFVRAQVPLHVG